MVWTCYNNCGAGVEASLPNAGGKAEKKLKTKEDMEGTVSWII